MLVDALCLSTLPPEFYDIHHPLDESIGDGQDDCNRGVATLHGLVPLRVRVFYPIGGHPSAATYSSTSNTRTKSDGLGKARQRGAVPAGSAVAVESVADSPGSGPAMVFAYGFGTVTT